MLDSASRKRTNCWPAQDAMICCLLWPFVRVEEEANPPKK